MAQTFTAGVSGELAGINIDVLGIPRDPTFPLHVAIRTVDADGRPTATVLGETTLDSNSASLSELIQFPQAIEITAGTQYAIVVNYEGAPPPRPGGELGSWLGADNDQYTRGRSLISFEDGLTWHELDPGFDCHFRTYVLVETTGGGTAAVDQVPVAGGGL